jgi:hypothetical protein
MATLRSVREYWPMFFMLVVLKVPVIGMIYLLWWAAQPVVTTEAGDEDGGDGGRRVRRPKSPRGPRRGPHGPGGIVRPVPHEGRSRRPASQPVGAPDSARSRDRSISRDTER